ncbi:MAG: phenylalanine--tRNA ligase subunit beta, partial [Clostridia bacterium]|nr:phenylalanine--tRNA ligase subunit beta [Clostridia bacterium]
NYVMMELGQPMHAFDNAKVDKIEVQTFPEPFKFTTLDGVERDIDPTMLMITSGDAPVAVAGVMGGDASKITDSTTSLLLESATFSGVSVRKTSSKLGLRTDASMRYEKMLDPELCRLATERVLALIMDNDSGAKVISSFTDAYVYHYPVITLNFDKSYVDRYTGIDIPNETIVTTLTGLGFGVKLCGEDYTVTVPSWRSTKDVTIKADIIEEISRIYGYDNFDVCTSVSPLRPVRAEVQKSYEDRMKDILVESYGMHEAHSYIWSDDKKNRELGIETPENVRIINAQTPDHQYIRVSMIPTLLSFVKENRTWADSFGIFEIGHTVEGLRADNGYCNERKKLGAVLYSKTEGEEALFMKLSALACDLVGNILHKEPIFREMAPVYGFEHPANCFSVSVDGDVIGFLSVPHPTVNANIDKKCAVAFLEIDTAIFAGVQKAPISYKVPSKFPEIEIDLTFNTILASVKFDEIAALAKEQTELLTSVVVKDIYNTEDGRCALTLRFAFVSAERTLTKQELAPVTEKIIKALSELGLSYS